MLGCASPLNEVTTRESMQASEFRDKRPMLPWFAFLQGVVFDVQNGAANIGFAVEKYLPAALAPGRWRSALWVRESRLGMQVVFVELHRPISFKLLDHRLRIVPMAADDKMDVIWQNRTGPRDHTAAQEISREARADRAGLNAA